HYYDYTGGEKEPGYGLFEYKTGALTKELFKMADLVPEGQTKAVKMQGIKMSPDEKRMLVATETEAIYRYSTKVSNYVYDLATKKMFPLSVKGKQRLAAFSPDGKKIAFVRDNNIFLVDIESRAETQVTMDGEWNKIINGGTDWVYEEEFALPNGLYWSPDSRKIAFYRFDESHVKEFQMTMYNTGLYPAPYTYKYPKAGEENSFVTLHIYDITTKQIIPVDVGKETDQYIPRVNWTNDANTLSFFRMNRLQNKLEVLLTNTNDGTSKVLFTETRDTYIEINDYLTFLPDGKSFIWGNDDSGFMHLYIYGMDGKRKSQITSGEWEVIDFYGYDEKSKTLFYKSNEGNPTQRVVYSIRIDGKEKKKLSEMAGTNTADFSEGLKYFINTWSDANTPYKITLHASDGKQIKVLEDNAALQERAREYGFVKKEFFTITNAEGHMLHGWMMKPADLNTSDASSKYPVLQVVYGGPGHNTVNDQWEGADFYWYQLLAQKGYIVVSFDNRGTEYRGSAFKKSTYGKMGKLESADQIDAATYMGTLPYVDKSRIGIWGWSYGGYLSSLCLAVGADVFKMAMAVAPVSNWRYYDSIYTERYMGLPQDNAKGYDEYSPTHNMAKMKGNFLLVHGTGDDNVHFQNSVALVNALVDANKQFDFYIYPDKNHGIRGGNARLHLYTKMTEFLEENL
ncbi:MAG TPA: S9 family peptidase, partial [Bacteroidia bacterium]|nr:S9 family peptidase [Bacteroidia bacterium]